MEFVCRKCIVPGYLREKIIWRAGKDTLFWREKIEDILGDVRHLPVPEFSTSSHSIPKRRFGANTNATPTNNTHPIQLTQSPLPQKKIIKCRRFHPPQTLNHFFQSFFRALHFYSRFLFHHFTRFLFPHFNKQYFLPFFCIQHPSLHFLHLNPSPCFTMLPLQNLYHTPNNYFLNLFTTNV